jgi:hypothetical protein
MASFTSATPERTPLAQHDGAVLEDVSSYGLCNIYIFPFLGFAHDTNDNATYRVSE